MRPTYESVIRGASEGPSLVETAREEDVAIVVMNDPEHLNAMAKPLLRAAADVGWHQAMAMEEFAEPLCFTTQAHREAVRALVARKKDG